MNFPSRYRLWNLVLTDHCLLSDAVEGTVLLTVTPRILARALGEAGEGPVTPEEAEADFVAAVAAVYGELLCSENRGLSALEARNDDGIPLSVSFLALSVLAAYHMHTDDEHTGRAYYPRLASLLGTEIAGTQPLGFDGASFVRLWEDLSAWLEGSYQRRLALPQNVGLRRYLAYPFEHVPLRLVDIDRLPRFFETYGYEPGARAPLDRLEYDLWSGAGPWRQLTESGQGALQDPRRRPFVIRQVAYELEHWDGCRRDAFGRHIASVEVWMDIRSRRASLSLLARRPPGFPEVIEQGEFYFESSEEGWYEPVLLSRGDGPLLSEGLRVENGASRGRYVLQLRPCQVLAFTPAETHSGFVSDRVLRLESRCAVLCTDRLTDEVAAYLAVITQDRVNPRNDATLPDGWRLFTDIRPATMHDPPEGLEPLRVESSVALLPRGGLRLRRRWAWLQGAAARVAVMGGHRSQEIRVDGVPVEVDNDCFLPATLFHAIGEHVVEIGDKLRQRVVVLEGTVHPDCRSWLPDPPVRAAVALPAGQWVLLGAEPGRKAAVSVPLGGRVVTSPYESDWAVSVGAGPAAQVMHLHFRTGEAPGPPTESTSTPLSPKQGLRTCDRQEILSWAEAVYQASVRRPRITCSLLCCQPAELAKAWRGLFEQARSIKRKLRTRRR